MSGPRIALLPVDDAKAATAVAGIAEITADLLRSLDVPLEDGVTSWPPDGRGPA